MVSSLFSLAMVKNNNRIKKNKKKMGLKNLSWQQWTAFGLVVALIITVVVLHLVQPEVSFAFTEIASVVTFLVGVVVGYLFGKKKCVCTKKQLLTD